MKSSSGKKILIIATLCIFAFILMNSAFGSASYSFSGAVHSLLKKLGIEITEFNLRKLAHLTEYALLGFFLMLLLRKKKFGFLLVLLLGAATGTADELIQTLSPFRHALVRDVLLDVAGTGMGAASVALILFF